MNIKCLAIDVVAFVVFGNECGCVWQLMLLCLATNVVVIVVLKFYLFCLVCGVWCVVCESGYE